MSQGNYSVRLLEDPLDEFLSIAGESLLSSDRALWNKFVQRVGRDNLRGVYAGSRLAGGLAFYRMAHWFGGQTIPCGGISCVSISPSDRGSGACATLLRSVLGELRSEGIPLASLYASTQRLYRTVGFEHAGTQTHYSIPMSSLATTDRSLPAHRFEAAPLELLSKVSDQRAAATNGNITRTTGLWQRLTEPYDAPTITYVFGNLDQPEGYAIMKVGSRAGGVPQPLVSTDVAANTPAAKQRLLALVRDHRSMCDSFQWYGSPNDPLIFLADEQWVTLKYWMRWMLRIVDLPAALSARGYCPHVEGTLHLDVRDSCLSENQGRWQVHLSGGKATVEPGGQGHLQMDIRALAPLYSAYFSAPQLIQMGAIQSASDEQTKLATAALAGDAPWLVDLF